MKVKRRELVEGCIVVNDVMALTNKPIIPKKTVLTAKHLDVLEAFLINDIHIQPILASGKPFQTNNQSDSNGQRADKQSLLVQYLKAVQVYKQFFTNWQSGANIDIYAFRHMIIPLIEAFIEKPSQLFSLYNFVEKKDYIFHHAVTVGLLSAFLAKKLDYVKGDWLQIGIAGALCDSGMSKVDPILFHKAGSLTPIEFDQLKQHTLQSYKLLKDQPAIQSGVKLAALQHHEREDGSGYPMGVPSEKLHPFSKIVAVSDVFHAMVSERAYQQKQSMFKVLEIMVTEQFGKFQHKVLKALLDEAVKISIGTRVRLTNYEIGEIIFIQPQSPTRPIIRLKSGDIMPLTENPDVFIEEILN